MKLFTLTANELKKIFAKTGTIVLIVLLLVIAAGMPVLQKQLSAVSFYDETSYIQDEYENAKASYESAKTSADLTQLIYAASDLERLELVLDANIASYSDWRMQKTYDLTQDIQRREAYSVLLSGNEKRIKQLEESEFISLIDSDALEQYYLEDSTVKLKKELGSLNTQIEAFKTAIIQSDSTYFSQKEVDSYTALIEEYNKQIKTLQKELKKDKDRQEEIQSQIDDLTLQKEIASLKLSYAQMRISMQVTYEETDWKNKTINECISLIDTIHTPIPSKQEFEAMYLYEIQSQGLTYEEFVQSQETQKQKASDQLLINEYSLLNDMPREDLVDSSRAVSTGVYNFIALTAFFVVILASSIVSREFHKGTIRLLLTRSAARWKILLSKFLAVLLLGIGMLALSCALYLGVVLLLYGTADFSIPLLSVENGVIVETPMLVRLLSVLAKSAIDILFFLSLAFFFTTVVKNTALAVAVPLVLMMFSPVVSSLVAISNSDIAKTILSYTPVAYTDLASLWQQQLSANSAFSVALGDTFTFDPVLGIIVLGVYSVVLIAVSFAVFVRRDIK